MAEPLRLGRAVRLLIVNERQREILNELIVDGAGNAEIADRLGIERDTVNWYLKGVYKSAGVNNRAALAVGLLRNRWKIVVR